MRIVRLGFSRMVMSTIGLSKTHFKQILDKLPDDAEIVGFGHDSTSYVDYVFVKSSCFREVPDASIPPDVVAHFQDFSLGYGNKEVKLSHIDFGDALEKQGQWSQSYCNHTWTPYTGLTQTYDYCANCGVKKP